MDDEALANGPEARLAKLLIASGVRASAALCGALYRLQGAFGHLEITRDLRYGDDPAQRLELWRPRAVTRARPLVVFLHGGGFQHLDPATHWAFAHQFAAAGCVVVSAGYRLAPTHRFPAAADDAARVLDYARSRAHELGADPAQLVLAGTSAGANLALGLAIVRAAVHPVRAAVLFSGLLQVTDPARLYRDRPLSRIRRARIASIAHDYLGRERAFRVPDAPDARLDPLAYLERHPIPAGFPPVFSSTGTRDEVRDDAVRLHTRLEAASARSVLDLVSNAGHGFQALIFQERVRALWTRVFAFLRDAGVQPSGALVRGVAS